MKTRREWLQELPDGYREIALKNAGNRSLGLENESMMRALEGAFRWEHSPEGHTFWSSVRDHYKEGTLLPPLPLSEQKEGQSTPLSKKVSAKQSKTSDKSKELKSKKTPLISGSKKKATNVKSKSSEKVVTKSHK